MEKGDKSGKLIFFDKETFDKAFEMEVGNSDVIKVNCNKYLKMKCQYNLHNSFPLDPYI